jgi:hypothetical protein
MIGAEFLALLIVTAHCAAHKLLQSTRNMVQFSKKGIAGSVGKDQDTNMKFTP